MTDNRVGDNHVLEDDVWLVTRSGREMIDLREVVHMEKEGFGKTKITLRGGSGSYKVHCDIHTLGPLVRRIKSVTEEWRNLYAIREAIQ